MSSINQEESVFYQKGFNLLGFGTLQHSIKREDSVGNLKDSQTDAEKPLKPLKNQLYSTCAVHTHKTIRYTRQFNFKLKKLHFKYIQNSIHSISNVGKRFFMHINHEYRI